MTFQKIHDLVQTIGLVRAINGSTTEFEVEWRRRAENLSVAICTECGVNREEAAKLPRDLEFAPEGHVVREYTDTVNWLYSAHEDFEDLLSA